MHCPATDSSKFDKVNQYHLQEDVVKLVANNKQLEQDEMDLCQAVRSRDESLVGT